MSRRAATAPEPITVGQVFAYRLRDARLSRRWKQQDLADAMAAIGHPINRATIAKIEKGATGVGGAVHGSSRPTGSTQARPVSLTEAVAFAVALNVAPVNLFVPISGDDKVQLTPSRVVETSTAQRWARGDESLDPDGDDRFYRSQSPRRSKPATLEDLAALGIKVITTEKES